MLLLKLFYSIDFSLMVLLTPILLVYLIVHIMKLIFSLKRCSILKSNKSTMYHYLAVSIDISSLAVWLCSNICRISEVSLCRTRLVLGWVTNLWVGMPPQYVTNQLDQLSFAFLRHC